jgi:hypothetical protein
MPSDPILRRGDMAVTGIAAIFAGNSAEIIDWLRGRQTKDLEYERINRNAAADLIERQQKEIEELRGAMRAYDERLRTAGESVGIAAGCDTPEGMADEITRLRLALKENTIAAGLWNVAAAIRSLSKESNTK